MIVDFVFHASSLYQLPVSDVASHGKPINIFLQKLEILLALPRKPPAARCIYCTKLYRNSRHIFNRRKFHGGHSPQTISLGLHVVLHGRHDVIAARRAAVNPFCVI